MSAVEPAYTTLRVSVNNAEKLRELKNRHEDPNLDRTVTRLLDHWEGAP